MQASVQPVRFEGVADYYRHIARHVYLRVTNGKPDVIAAIGLLDLYGLDAAIPFPSGVNTKAARYKWAKQHVEEHVNHPKFHQHFAVHEVEAWLLSDANIFPTPVRKVLTPKSSAPEDINFDEPPARLLSHTYRQKLRSRYKKAVDGPNLFQSLDPDIARAKCPCLKAMLDDMLALSRQAGL